MIDNLRFIRKAAGPENDQRRVKMFGGSETAEIQLVDKMRRRRYSHNGMYNAALLLAEPELQLLKVSLDCIAAMRGKA